jgi:hypothetical protein
MQDFRVWRRRSTLLLVRILACTVLSLLVLAAPVSAKSKSGGGTAAPTSPPPAAPAPAGATGTPGTAKLVAGVARAPAGAPAAVRGAIRAGNALQTFPYRYGGGHRRFIDKGYDCSGTVSYALHFAGLLDSPLDSSSFMRWGVRGKGQWFTVYTNPGHAFLIVAGLRLDTSAAGVSAAVAKKIPTATESGPRWRPTLRSTRGFRSRHPLGF